MKNTDKFVHIFSTVIATILTAVVTASGIIFANAAYDLHGGQGFTSTDVGVVILLSIMLPFVYLGTKKLVVELFERLDK